MQTFHAVTRCYDVTLTEQSRSHRALNRLNKLYGEENNPKLTHCWSYNVDNTIGTPLILLSTYIHAFKLIISLIIAVNFF